MSDYNPIPEYIREITELNLTKWGQIKLVGFNEATILYARDVVKRSKPSFKNFGFLLSVALKYSKENSFPVNWQKVDYLKKLLGMSDDAPMELPKPPEPPRPHKNQTQTYFQELADRVAKSNQEDPFQAALAVERHYAFSPDGQRFVRNVGSINPWLGRLTNDDQKRIMEIVSEERNTERNA